MDKKPTRGKRPAGPRPGGQRPPVRSHMDPYRKREDLPRERTEEENVHLIEGRNAVIEALRTV